MMSSMRFVLALLTVLLFTGTHVAAAESDVLAYASLDEGARTIRVQSAGQWLRGVYYPTSELDHDKGEITRPDRYRLPGRFGSGLTFFADAQSFAEVPNFSLRKPQEELVISLFMKTRRSRTSVLISNRSDGATSGFALVSRLNHLHFYYGDGSQKFSAKSDRAVLSNGEWHWVKLIFRQGQVSFIVDNESYGTRQLAGRAIAPGSSTLTLGNYPLPGKGREMYSFGGALDEIMIATNEQAVDERMQQRASEAGESAAAMLERNIFDATAQPIDGNEMHFGGQRVFHSFPGHPVPLSFLFKGNKDEVESASLVFYVPERIVCREVFSSAHNYSDEVVALEQTAVMRHGEPYRRYETIGYDLTENLTKTFSVMLTAALDVADTDGERPAEARIDWGYVANGKEIAKEPFTLRFLSMLPAVAERGRFEVMNYFLGNGMAFHDPALQRNMADLFSSSGMTGKGRFYSHDRRRVAFDNFLKERGFTLYNISLWQGPFSKQAASLVAKGLARPSITASGKPDPTHPCPTDVIHNESFQAAYREMVRNKLRASQDGEWVVYDFEPWGVPSNFCFCEQTLADFRSKYPVEGKLTPERLKSEYRDQWTLFWLDMTTEIYRVWTEAVHAANPTLKISEYTYVFNYDDPNLRRRFFDIPKDPRRIETYVDETMLSIYNFHGRKLFDSLSQNLDVLDKPIMPIALLARPHELMSYATPVGSLSPQRIYQRAILVAALGCERMALYPGKFIDGAYHQALGRASRLIWEHEAFFFDGQRCDEKVSVALQKGSEGQDDFAYTLHENDNRYALSLFNFSDSEQTYAVDLGELAKKAERIIENDEDVRVVDGTVTIKVSPHDLKILQLLP